MVLGSTQPAICFCLIYGLTNIHAYAHVCTCVSVCVHLYIEVQSRCLVSVYITCLLTETGLLFLLNPELVSSSDSLHWLLLSLPFSKVLGSQAAITSTQFLQRFWSPDSGLHPCSARTFSTEPSPQPSGYMIE